MDPRLLRLRTSKQSPSTPKKWSSSWLTFMTANHPRYSLSWTQRKLLLSATLGLVALGLLATIKSPSPTLAPSPKKQAVQPSSPPSKMQSPLLPNVSPQPVETWGKATWYLPTGKRTASGARYQKNLLTCAHRTLPFGTRLRVSHTKNGIVTSVIVTVTDRTPTKSKILVDLTPTAFAHLAPITLGHVNVSILPL